MRPPPDPGSNRANICPLLVKWINNMQLPKHILVIVQNSPIESDRRVEREVLALLSSGYKVSLICPKPSKEAVIKRINGANIYRFNTHLQGNNTLSYILEYLSSLIQIAAISLIIHLKDRVSIIQVCNPPDVFFILGMMFRISGTKFVFDQHDPTPEVYLSRFSHFNKHIYKMLRIFEYLTLTTADAVIVTNESAKRIAMERANLHESHIYVVRNGPFLTASEADAIDDGLKAGHKYMVCCIGAIAPQDGVEYLLLAAEYLIKVIGRNDIIIILAGGGSDTDRLKHLARDKNIEDHVHFTGWIYDKQKLAAILSTADVCAAPEPKSNCNDLMTFVKILDYMEAGKPIVAFDLVESRYSAGPAALYAKPNDYQDFAKKIAFLVDNEKLRIEMGAIAKARSVSSLRWEFFEPIYLDTFKSL
jgi:glycosyltransferase involved in cell wall biosynthesis